MLGQGVEGRRVSRGRQGIGGGRDRRRGRAVGLVVMRGRTVSSSDLGGREGGGGTKSRYLLKRQWVFWSAVSFLKCYHFTK